MSAARVLMGGTLAVLCAAGLLLALSATAAWNPPWLTGACPDSQASRPVSAGAAAPLAGDARGAAVAPTAPRKLHATAGSAFVTADGQAQRLNGLNITPVSRNHPDATLSPGRYAEIRARGFNTVRFVLHWDVMEPARGRYDGVAFATLDTAIRGAKAAGLYVVLDMIHLWGQDGLAYVPAWARSGDSVHSVRVNAGPYLSLLAGRYRNERAVAAYDLVNEFHRFPIDQNAVLRTYDNLIGKVRRFDRRKIIILEPTYGDSSIVGKHADFSLLRHRSNVVWSTHDYFAGHHPTGYRADGAQAGRYTWNGRTGYTAGQTDRLDRHLRVTLAKLAQVRLPLWIGEYGIGEGVPGHDEWIRTQNALFDKYGLGRAWWEYRTDGPFSATSADFAWKPWVDLIARR